MSQVEQEHVAAGDTAILQPVVIASARMGRPTALVLNPGASPAAYPLHRAVTLGRDPKNDICLDDQALSKSHLTLVPHPSGIEVIDLGSSNGTFLDSRPVDHARVERSAVLRAGNLVLRLCHLAEDPAPASTDGPLVGGQSFAAVRRQISLIGATDLPVLILGETGTGKEVCARLLHESSGREGPFVAVNCAALPETLAESELFGHTRGAFTGAERPRKGLFVVADGGTLFLDEIGELPLATQAKLLRVLEDKVVKAVGADSQQQVDVRIVAATNRDLAAEVELGRFRADLLARVAAVELRLPPLRERPEDLPALAAYLLRRAGLPGVEISPDALEAMALHDWPHNVRELDNLLRASVLGGAERVELAQLPSRLQQRLQRLAPRAASPELAALEPVAAPAGALTREQLIAALEASHGNVRRASQGLGVARGHVYRLLQRWGLDPANFREGQRRHDRC